MLGQNGGAVSESSSTADTLIKETTTAAFRQDVLTESTRQPVLVDFWAPWCGPCKQLTPVLEKAVKAAAGKVKLVKMNIDDHPQIAGQLGIKSIPAVIAFQRGQPVDGFMGALPEGQVKNFIERLVGPLQDEGDDIVAAAEAALAAGDATAAAALYAEAYEQAPEDAKLAAGLLRALVAAGDLEAARAILAEFPEALAKDAGVAAARASLELAEQAAALGDLTDLEQKVAADPTDYQARLDLALALNGRGMRIEAADALLEIIKRDRSWNDDGGRKQLVQFFEAWGPADPATSSARRKLSAFLFS